MEPLPGPPPLPILGNLLDLDLKNTIQSWLDLAHVHGPIYKLVLRGADRIIITGYEVIHEVCTRKDFVKRPLGVVKALRDITPEGLLTADHGQESWEMAHRVLVPAFGPLMVQDMFEEMHDIVSQLVLRWARFGEETPIEVTADFTRLALDTIALCAMDTRFNSFYKDSLHPFIGSLTSTLSETQLRSVRPAWMNSLFWQANKTFDDNNNLMHNIAKEVIARRRANPTKRMDLLNALLHGKDPVSQRGLSDETISDNMITFLIAGHETTAGLLSFFFYLLLKNPEAYGELQKEIDTVLGTGPLTPECLTRLPYTKACLRETLRLHPPVPGFALSPWQEGSEPTVIGGKYQIGPEAGCLILLGNLHKDKTIYGDDAEDFRPSRMLEENFKKLPPNSFMVRLYSAVHDSLLTTQPFGRGTRACIGSDFAMQEAIMAVAILIQNFDFRFMDPNYTLKVKQASTLKPVNLFISAKLRPGISLLSLNRDLFSHASGGIKPSSSSSSDAQGSEEMQPMTILYGSNTGTCQNLADRLARTALQHGFRCTIKSLNEGLNSVPTDQAVVVISSTHSEGQPPDNAVAFLEWLDSQKENALKGLKYAVFGCGNSDWKETYQTIPMRLDEKLEKTGGLRLAARGEADAGEGDIIGEFDTWQADCLWPAVSQLSQSRRPAGKAFTNVQLTNDTILNVSHPPQGRIIAKVLTCSALTAHEDRPKHHMTVQLPDGAGYQVGDYLEIYPPNPAETTERFLDIIRAWGYSVSDPLAVALYTQCELNQPASLKAGADDRVALQALYQDLLETGVRRPSILQLLATYQTITMPLADLAALLPPIRPRQYSISSSPRAHPTQCTLTWSLITHEAIHVPSWQSNQSSRGTASHYLASLSAGDELTCSVRPGQSRFRPPADHAVPIVMVSAGSGIAPFRGFIQEREAMIRQNPAVQLKLGRAILYVGCRTPDHALYAAELDTSPAVEVRYAYSRYGNGPQYVQNLIWADRHELAELWESGSRVYVCGGRMLGQGVKETVCRIYRELAEERCGAKSQADIEQWWVEALRSQYSVDIF
ncbi:P450 family fatty acid hydroxylase [Paramyrothecium foliicola]|nr:P450 family fatty acid hydroxylase [Paramyrothecium foliicola]